MVQETCTENSIYKITQIRPKSGGFELNPVPEPDLQKRPDSGFTGAGAEIQYTLAVPHQCKVAKS